MRFWRSRRWPVWLAGMLAIAAVLAVAANAPRTAERLNTLVFDSYQQLKPRRWAGAPVLILDIDEASLDKVGQWPWPRDLLGEITARLTDLGAAAVVFDVLFSEPDRTSPARVLERMRERGATVEVSGLARPDNDAAFAEAIARSNVVTSMVFDDNARSRPPPPKAAKAFGGTDPTAILRDWTRAVANLAVIDEAAAGTGVIVPATSLDGVVRRVPLVFAAGGEIYPALTVEALRVAQGASTVLVRASDGSGEIAGDAAPRITAIKVGALELPTDAKGQLRVHHTPQRDKPVLPMHRMLAAPLDPAEAGLVAGRLVLVGSSAPGLLDLRATPLDRIVPGVSIHADIIDQAIAQRFLTRPDWAEGAELSAALLLGLLAVAVIPFFTPLAHALWATLLIALATTASWFLFALAPDTTALAGQSYLVSPLLPAATVFAGYAMGSGARLLLSERDERFVRRAFGLYLAPAMVDRLAEAPDRLKLGGEERELTILFCDIRGFTTLSEGLDPVELTTLLNDFLTPMTRALMERGATIDKYMGDAIMAFWNAPLDQPDHAARAIDGMLAMRGALEELNAVARRPIAIGVGLNTGPCCVGNLGSEQRFNYSAIGDAVNVASRIEGLTKAYGLDNLVAAETVRAAEGTGATLAHLEIDRVGVVGRAEPLVVHTVLGEPPANFEALRERHARFLEAWRDAETEAARAALAEARAAAPPDHRTLYDHFAARLATFEHEGWPEGWDGVTRATSK